MFGLLSDCWSSGTSHPSQKKLRLDIETLERREVPTAGIFYDAQLQVVKVVGTNGGDKVIFSIDNNGTTGQYNSHWDDKLVVKWTHGGVTTKQSFNLFTPIQPGENTVTRLISRVQFDGGAGNDKCYNNTTLPSWQFGKDGNDVLSGGIDSDYIVGGKGSDTIHGGAGDDDLWGRQYYTGESDVDNAVDRLYGGKGYDKLSAEGTRTSYLDGGDQDDYLWGAYGQGITNFLNGGKGSDYMEGGYGTNRQFGVLNIMKDHSGIDKFFCADYATNLVNCKDGNLPDPFNWPSEQYDRVNKSAHGIDLVTLDTNSILRLPDKYQSNLFNQISYYQV